MGIKDVFCTNDLPTTASSRMLQSELFFCPKLKWELEILTECSFWTDYTSPFEATVVKRLKAAGAVMIGKTNLDEFGMGSEKYYEHTFATRLIIFPRKLGRQT